MIQCLRMLGILSEIASHGSLPLIISVEDDRFGTAATARDIAGVVANFRLIIHESGGHIWLGHDKDVADEVARFVSDIGSA